MGKSPDRVQLFREDHDRVDIKGMVASGLAKGFAWIGDAFDQQVAAATLGQIDREETGCAGSAGAHVSAHGAIRAGTCVQRTSTTSVP